MAVSQRSASSASRTLLIGIKTSASSLISDLAFPEPVVRREPEADEPIRYGKVRSKSCQIRKSFERGFCDVERTGMSLLGSHVGKAAVFEINISMLDGSSDTWLRCRRAQFDSAQTAKIRDDFLAGRNGNRRRHRAGRDLVTFPQPAPGGSKCIGKPCACAAGLVAAIL